MSWNQNWRSATHSRKQHWLIIPRHDTMQKNAFYSLMAFPRWKDQLYHQSVWVLLRQLCDQGPESCSRRLCTTCFEGSVQILKSWPKLWGNFQKSVTNAQFEGVLHVGNPEIQSIANWSHIVDMEEEFLNISQSWLPWKLFQVNWMWDVQYLLTSRWVFARILCWSLSTVLWTRSMAIDDSAHNPHLPLSDELAWIYP